MYADFHQALHRPYIFTNPKSRTAALKAGLDILRAQRQYFNHINAIHYKMFSLVLNTFDAIILVAAIYILHPHENKEDLDDTLQHFDWAMERFQVISSRNAMANAALSVLKAISLRLKKALSRAKSTEITSTPYNDQSSSTTTPDSVVQPYPTPHSHPSISSASTTSSTNVNNNSSQYTLPTISNLTEATPVTAGLNPSWDAFTGPVSMPNYDFSNMAPLQPMHDLLFNDLGTVDSGIDLNNTGYDLQNRSSAWLGGAAAQGTNGQQWQFEGDFGNDSFWEFMNSYNP